MWVWRDDGSATLLLAGAADQAVTSGTISSGSTLAAPTTAAGAVAVTGGTIASGATITEPTVSAPAVTLEFCCSGHCGWSGGSGAAPTGATKHIFSVLTPAGVSVSTLDGQPCWQMTGAASRSYLTHDFDPWPAVFVWRAYIRFPSALPDTDIGIIGAYIVSNGYGVFFNPTGSLLVARAGPTSGGSVAIAPDTTYRVDVRVNVNGTSHTTEVSVDGTPLATATRTSQTATVFDNFRWGFGTATGTPTGTVLIQALAVSRTSIDYPIGPGQTVGLRPNGDGTHVMSAVTDFKYNNTTDMPSTSPTDIWSYLDDVPDNTTDFISMHGAAGEYCAVWFDNMPGTTQRVNGIEVVSAHHSSGATPANTQSLWLRDGTTDGPVHDDADFSATTLHLVSKHFPQAPSGVEWTASNIANLRARFGSSRIGTPVVSPVPFIDALVLEVDYVGTADQSVTNGTAASALALFAATLIPQAVALSAGTIASALAVTAPTMIAVGAVTVTGGTIASGSAATAPSTITVGAVTLTGGTIASGSVVFTAHAITAGPVAATTGTIASGSVATAPSTVTVGATTVVGGTIAGTTFFPPTVIPQAIDITGGTIAATVLSAPSVGAGAIAVTGDTITSGSFLTAPAVAVGAVTVAGGTIVSGAVVSGPTIVVGAVVVMTSTIASGSTLSPPTVILAGAQVLTDSTVDAGPWTDQLGGTTDLHSPLADVDTLTWDQSPFNPVNATMKLGLTDLPAPGVGEKLVLSIQCEQI